MDWIRWIWAPRLGTRVAPIRDLKFIKGSAFDIPNLQGKKVVVLEQWATWCKPCIHSIPHLTQLAQQYPHVLFVSVTQEKDHTAVKAFVDAMGDEMGVAVAIDDTGSISQLVRDSAGIGIPHCMVIDAEGYLAWAGHPLEAGMRVGLDTALGLYN
ncbi:hypothetical protein HDU78_009156 [Chytriomyces hyalinus]|nr:hypothetical protein HDU78_009156 [Chytriomyces hyalinus]